MRKTVIAFLLVCCFFANVTQAQNKGSELKDSMNVINSSFGSDLLGGIKGGLVCIGGIAVSSALIGAAYAGSLPETIVSAGFVAGLVGLSVSALAVPFLVTYGVNHARMKSGSTGNYWLGLAGSLVSSAACFGLSRLIYDKAPGLRLPGGIVSILLIIPAGTALAYQLFGNPKRGAGISGSLLNLDKGAFSLSTPIPVIYPDPRMGNRIATQFSLLSVTF